MLVWGLKRSLGDFWRSIGVSERSFLASGRLFEGRDYLVRIIGLKEVIWVVREVSWG